MPHTENIEEKFAKQIKELCDKESGKENNPSKSGEIIYQIGKIYRKRSPDKFSLIKSAGLFNAAIVRNPCNVSQIESDLIELCLHVLQQAKARNQNADLIQKATLVKTTSIHKLRKEVRDFIQRSKLKIPVKTIKDDFQNLMKGKISAIKQINEIIADQYKHIMAELSQFCEDVMGKPPCEYAIVGKGSLARKEITPYSDFENIMILSNDILLCTNQKYEEHLEYFRWFSVIFHVIILNVQETIIPSLNVSVLKGKDPNEKDTWYYDAITPNGISLDGMMPHACKFPLGRQTKTTSKQFIAELIKPVKEILEYLTTKTNLKYGYHLSDILTKTCFVFGNKNVFKQFEDGAQCYRDQKSPTDVIKDVQTSVTDDLKKFSLRFRLTKLNSQDKINIKQLVYQSTTIFVAALSQIHNISANLSFDIINELEKHKKITEHTAHKLRCAVAIACEIRLKVYMKKESQCDEAVDLKHSDEGVKNFLDIVGVESTVNYFQVAYCLQCEVAKQLNLTKLHFYSNPELINITIG